MKEGLGKQGENLAFRFLKEKGFKILERNYRAPWGEIDIIAREKACLAFIEVKARKSILFGHPFEYVGEKKQKKILLTAQHYLTKMNWHSEEIRFDVVSIHLPEDGSPAHVELIRNAFSE